MNISMVKTKLIAGVALFSLSACAPEEDTMESGYCLPHKNHSECHGCGWYVGKVGMGYVKGHGSCAIGTIDGGGPYVRVVLVVSDIG